MKYLISLGGSLIVTNKIETAYLKKFRSLILERVKKGDKFLVTTGGGGTSRLYQNAARDFGIKNYVDLDLLGIEACKINAMLVSSYFAGIKKSQVEVVSGGLKPGGSSDTTSIFFAKKRKMRLIVNLTNVSGIYSRNPKKYKNVKLIRQMTWDDLVRKFGPKRFPGQNVPFDQTAAKEAKKSGIAVIIFDGRELANLKKYFEGGHFLGTIIEP